mmetsp:Transcript_24386/g.37299  ORF Transcript_24386/g.37299 Transcript_24386/m.37299 type:complete len:84 (-) Transcript_24386:75-326(-)
MLRLFQKGDLISKLLLKQRGVEERRRRRGGTKQKASKQAINKNENVKLEIFDGYWDVVSRTITATEEYAENRARTKAYQRLES